MDWNTELRAVEIRKFNRFYTNILGLVNKTILASPYSLAEVRVLLEIQIAGRCTASDLTRLLGVDAGYLSRILRRFKKDQLVTMTRSDTDGRAQVLALTARGETVMNQLSDASTQQIIALLGQLPAADQELLVRHMQGVQAILTRQADKVVTIRSHQPGDAGYIVYRHAVLYQQEYNLSPVFEQYVIAGLTNFFANPQGGNIWVAECAGRIVGSIAIVGCDAATAQLRWFLIEPEFRGLGVGRQLVQVAMDFCRQNNYRQVFLWTFRGLDAARHLYESFGFVRTEEVENTTWQDQIVEERWQASLVD